MKKSFLLCSKIALSATLALSTAQAADHSHHMQHPVQHSQTQSPSSQILDSMHKPMMEVPFVTSGNVEKDFLSNMIAHHQGAIDSSKLLLDFSENPTTRRIAQSIITAQEKEIKEFKALLKSQNYTTTDIKDSDYKHFVEQAKSDMDKMMQAMMQTPITQQVEKDYLSAMIAHHQGAVEASKQILEYSKDKTISKIANNIIQDQEKEIQEFTTLLKTEFK